MAVGVAIVGGFEAVVNRGVHDLQDLRSYLGLLELAVLGLMVSGILEERSVALYRHINPANQGDHHTEARWPWLWPAVLLGLIGFVSSLLVILVTLLLKKLGI